MNAHPPAWRERIGLWIIDGALLGLFMASVGVFASLLYSPRSPLFALAPTEFTRGVLMGLAMGLTAVALIYSPWGARSGAHMNPAVTLAFLRLGRIRPIDAAGYVAAQTVIGVGATAGIGLVVGGAFTDAPVMYAPTVPGPWGPIAALAAEFAMTFLMMTAVLHASNRASLAPFMGLIAGTLLFAYIAFESPVSGMSINPARTIASALPSGVFAHLWVYLAGPIAGMLVAAEVFRFTPRAPRPHCCKLNHADPRPCVHCGCDGPINFDAHKDDPHER